MRASPAATTVSSGWNLRLAALYGSDTRLTSSTMSLARTASTSTLEVSPMMPTMVIWVPVLQWQDKPMDSMPPISSSTLCRSASGFNTIIIQMPSFPS